MQIVYALIAGFVGGIISNSFIRFGLFHYVLWKLRRRKKQNVTATLIINQIKIKGDVKMVGMNFNNEFDIDLTYVDDEQVPRAIEEFKEISSSAPDAISIAQAETDPPLPTGTYRFTVKGSNQADVTGAGVVKVVADAKFGEEVREIVYELAVSTVAEATGVNAVLSEVRVIS